MIKHDVMTISEASRLYEREVSTLRRKFAKGSKNITPDFSCWKSEDIWLVKRSSMDKEYMTSLLAVKHKVLYDGLDSFMGFEDAKLSKNVADERITTIENINSLNDVDFISLLKFLDKNLKSKTSSFRVKESLGYYEKYNKFSFTNMSKFEVARAVRHGSYRLK